MEGDIIHIYDYVMLVLLYDGARWAPFHRHVFSFFFVSCLCLIYVVIVLLLL